MKRNTVDSWSSQIVPTEAEEQKALIKWAVMSAAKYPELRLLYHIPNEGLRSWHQGRELKDQGLRKGVPDLCLPVARGGYHALYIEMKRRKDGKTSAEQKAWLDDLNRTRNRAVICEGWAEAAEEIMRYLKGGAEK